MADINRRPLDGPESGQEPAAPPKDRVVPSEEDAYQSGLPDAVALITAARDDRQYSVLLSLVDEITSSDDERITTALVSVATLGAHIPEAVAQLEMTTDEYLQRFGATLARKNHPSEEAG